MTASKLLELPRIEIRLSRQQLQILQADLEPMIDAAAMIGRNEQNPQSLIIAPARLGRCQARARELWDRFQQIARPDQIRYRLDLDIFEAGLCVAALRIARRARRRANFVPELPNRGQTKRRRSQLLPRLEKAREQARRRFRYAWGKTERSDSMMHEFTLYRRALAHQVLQPLCRFSIPGRGYFRLLIDRLVVLAAQGLQEAGTEAPPLKELREFVRQYLRRVRRYREDVAISDLRQETLEAKRRLVAFIQAKVRAATANVEDLSVALSRKADRLREVMEDSE